MWSSPFFFYNLTQPFYEMFMYLSSFPIGKDLLASLEDYFCQSLQRFAKQINLLYQMRAT